jgi:hypothetical protein
VIGSREREREREREASYIPFGVHDNGSDRYISFPFLIVVSIGLARPLRLISKAAKVYSQPGRERDSEKGGCCLRDNKAAVLEMISHSHFPGGFKKGTNFKFYQKE